MEEPGKTRHRNHQSIWLTSKAPKKSREVKGKSRNEAGKQIEDPGKTRYSINCADRGWAQTRPAKQNEKGRSKVVNKGPLVINRLLSF